MKQPSVRAPFLVLGLLLVACSGPESRPDAARPVDLVILHINDHHSRLDAESVTLTLPTASGTRKVKVDRGGFARITALMEELSAGHDNVLRLHAGDATTGDLYYTMTQGRADAELMNTVCFDAFTFGNHEFDNGDAGLATFLDALRGGTCKTAVVSANVRPEVGVSPLTPKTASDYFTPSAVFERRGQKIGVIGITVAGKTKASSRPDATTGLLDEAGAAQAEIDHLRATGINKIILLTHEGYDVDQRIAQKLAGVDVIVGGDSHTLLGGAALARYGLTPGGAYPTVTHDRDGKTVCVVQAWQYTHALGRLEVSFDAGGDVTRCAGTEYLPIGDNFAANDDDKAKRVPLTAQDIALIKADLATQQSLRHVAPSAAALAVLKPYQEQRAAIAGTVVGTATETLCLRRVPGSRVDTTSSTLGDVCNQALRVRAHGGDIQQLVAEAYLAQGKAYGAADIALLNAGGVRVDLARGEITLGRLYALLPFKNTLVRLTMSGQEIVDTLEDATDNVIVAKSTGAYPYAAGLRWRVDPNQPRGQRFSKVEVRQSDGSYAAIVPTATYRVIASDFIADGGDRYDTLKTITGARRENTYLDYAEPFIDYVKSKSSLGALPEADYSTQEFVDLR